MSPATKRTILWVALGGLALYFFGRCAPRSDDAELDRLVAVQLATGRAFRASLQAQQDSTARLDRQLALERARRLAETRSADSAHSVADSLAGALAGATSVRDSVLALLGERQALRLEVGSLRGVIRGLQGEADSLTVDRERWKALAVRAGTVTDSLALALQIVNTARKCRILGLAPCPSRVTVGVVSLVAGVVVGAVIR